MAGGKGVDCVCLKDGCNANLVSRDSDLLVKDCDGGKRGCKALKPYQDKCKGGAETNAFSFALLVTAALVACKAI